MKTFITSHNDYTYLQGGPVNYLVQGTLQSFLEPGICNARM